MNPGIHSQIEPAQLLVVALPIALSLWGSFKSAFERKWVVFFTYTLLMSIFWTTFLFFQINRFAVIQDDFFDALHYNFVEFAAPMYLLSLYLLPYSVLLYWLITGNAGRASQLLSIKMGCNFCQETIVVALLSLWMLYPWLIGTIAGAFSVDIPGFGYEPSPRPILSAIVAYASACSLGLCIIAFMIHRHVRRTTRCLSMDDRGALAE